jgi:REP element-mobilizing transposase RayT
MVMVTEMHLRESEGRGKRFDYRGMHRYLITLFVAKSFSALPSPETVLPLLSSLREAAAAHTFDVYAYCILPDRFVMIVRGKSEDSDMKKFLAAYRSLSTAHFNVHGEVLWHRRYRERVLRKTEATRDVAKNLFRLPVTLGLASSPEKYPLQGSFVIPSVNRRPHQAHDSRHRSGYRRRRR